MSVRSALRKYAPLGWMLVFPVLGLLYAWTNKVDGQPLYSLVTPLDRWIPFVKYFAVPYALWIFYIYLCLFYFLKKDIRVYYRSVLTYIVCTLVCYIIYSVFQTTVPRPVLTGNDPFTELVRYLYNRDQPYNCFPSIHCFSSYMVARMTFASEFRNKRNMTLIGGMSALIVLSTLFIKQHAVLDAIAAFLLVEAVVPFILALERSLLPRMRIRQRQRQLRT
jgi:hypothetical protein